MTSVTTQPLAYSATCCEKVEIALALNARALPGHQSEDYNFFITLRCLTEQEPVSDIMSGYWIKAKIRIKIKYKMNKTKEDRREKEKWSRKWCHVTNLCVIIIYLLLCTRCFAYSISTLFDWSVLHRLAFFLFSVFSKNKLWFLLIVTIMLAFLFHLFLPISSICFLLLTLGF